MDEKLKERLQKLKTLVIRRKTLLIFIVAFIIILYGMHIRTLNWPFLDGKWLSDPDAHLVLRYAQTILNEGKLPEVDTMRYYPIGFLNPGLEFGFISYFVVYLYKFLSFFDSGLTLTFVDIAFPALTFGFAMIFFFLLINKLFKWKIALLSTAFLIVLPQFLFRTLSGVSDKEALAIWFIFMAMYFFVMSFESKKASKNIIFGILAGISTAITAFISGLVNFLFFIFALYTLIIMFFDRFEKRDFLSYISWFIPTILILWISGKYDFLTLAFSFTSGLMILVFIMALFDFFVFKTSYIKLKIKEKIEHKMPLGLASIIGTFIIIFILTSVIFGPLFIPSKVSDLVYDALNPLQNRWARTVAESHQPYLVDWFGSFGGQIGVMLILAGACLMFYFMFSLAKKSKLKFLLAFIAFLLGLLFTRYSSSGVFNGESGLSRLLFVVSISGFIIFMGWYYIRLFYKEKEEYHRISNIERGLVFVVVWFLVTALAGRTAIRLLFVFSPAAAVALSYLFVRSAEIISSKIKSIALKTIVFVIIGLIAFSFLSNFTRGTVAQATYTGPIFNTQWQNAASWVKANTPEGSVFVHWWDYGYLVQTGFGRPTVTDGGNAAGSWNFFVGRYVLTAQNEKEALEFMKSHDVSYFLAVSDEIGKYPAFSSIGSNETYDRYSYIPVFSMDTSQTQETRNQTIYVYRGGFGLDEDFIYQGKLYPAGQAGIGAVLLPVSQQGNNTVIEQPSVIMGYNNAQVQIPLECVFVDDREVVFNNPGFKGCFRVLPVFSGAGQLENPIGAGLYVSERVRRTLFAQLYLFGKDSKNFEVAYSDEGAGAPLAIFSGRLIGPLKIWKVNYPADIKKNPVYVSTAYPNPNVTKINPNY